MKLLPCLGHIALMAGMATQRKTGSDGAKCMTSDGGDLFRLDIAL